MIFGLPPRSRRPTPTVSQWRSAGGPHMLGHTSSAWRLPPLSTPGGLHRRARPPGEYWPGRGACGTAQRLPARPKAVKHRDSVCRHPASPGQGAGLRLWPAERVAQCRQQVTTLFCPVTRSGLGLSDAQLDKVLARRPTRHPSSPSTAAKRATPRPSTNWAVNVSSPRCRRPPPTLLHIWKWLAHQD